VGNIQVASSIYLLASSLKVPLRNQLETNKEDHCEEKGKENAYVSQKKHHLPLTPSYCMHILVGTGTHPTPLDL
jgi:hypothetical protein